MNKLIYSLLFFAGITTLGCYHPSLETDLSKSSSITDDLYPVQEYDIAPNGKSKVATAQSVLYTPQAISTDHFPKLDQPMIEALKRQVKLLKYKKRKTPQKVGNLTVSNEQLEKTAEILMEANNNDPAMLSHLLNAYKIKGQDGRGNVHFTGYYTPVLKVSHTQSPEFPYPLYTFPRDWKGKLPSRADIDGKKGVLKGKGLELAYAKNLADIYIMQVQGSGIVEYENGTTELFAFTGTNKHSYSSIGNYMIRKGLTTAQHVSFSFIKKYLREHPEHAEDILFSNPSYVFFKPVNSNPKGAGLVPLTELHSIAVDTRYIPMGSILLGSVPVINNKNEVIRHDFKLLIAQDIGGAIKGPGHVDLYTGVGYPARKMASKLHHYGNLWLLLPNEELIAPLAQR